MIPQAYKSEFRNRKRRDGESLESFGEVIRLAARKAYPNKQADLLEGDLADQFIYGLNDCELGRHVQFSHPATLDQAVSATIEFESFKARQFEQIPVRKPRDLNPEAPVFVQAVQKEPSAVDATSESELGTLILEQFQKLDSRKKNFNNKISERLPLSQRKCFVCGELGHLSYDCPAKKDSKSCQGN